MRDSQIQLKHQQTARRQIVILAQLEFVKIRQEAYDRAIEGSTFLERVLWVFRAKGFMEKVDAIHKALDAESKKVNLERANKNAKKQKSQAFKDKVMS